METPDDTKQYEILNNTLASLKQENHRIIKTAKLKRFVSIAERENTLIDIIEELVHKVRRLEALEPDERPESPVPSQLPESGKMTKS